MFKRTNLRKTVVLGLLFTVTVYFGASSIYAACEVCQAQWANIGNNCVSCNEYLAVYYSCCKSHSCGSEGCNDNQQQSKQIRWMTNGSCTAPLCDTGTRCVGGTPGSWTGQYWSTQYCTGGTQSCS